LIGSFATSGACPCSWPGFNFQKVQALLVDNKTEQAWLWNDLKDNLEITTIPFINIPPAAKSYYSFLKWNGFNTVSVAVNTTDTDPDDMLRTLVHEAFHHYEQKDWNIPSSGWRTLTYPVDWKLRYFRRMSLLSLFKAYSFSTSLERAEAIKAATYWDHLVKETDSNDYQQNVGLDLVEGSASYTDIVTSALVRKGCLAAEPDLRTEILGRANEFFGILKVDQYGLDATWAAEPYDIGALSGLILRETAVVDWENRLKIDGTSPFTLLAQIYGQSVHEEDNLAMKDLMISKAKAYNLELVNVLGPIANGMTSANFLRVALPTKMQQGAIKIKGLIRVATIPEGIVMIQTSFQALSTTSDMDFTEQSIVRADKTPW